MHRIGYFHNMSPLTSTRWRIRLSFICLSMNRTPVWRYYLKLTPHQKSRLLKSAYLEFPSVRMKVDTSVHSFLVSHRSSGPQQWKLRSKTWLNKTESLVGCCFWCSKVHTVHRLKYTGRYYCKSVGNIMSGYMCYVYSGLMGWFSCVARMLFLKWKS